MIKYTPVCDTGNTPEANHDTGNTIPEANHPEADMELPGREFTFLKSIMLKWLRRTCEISSHHNVVNPV